MLLFSKRLVFKKGRFLTMNACSFSNVDSLIGVLKILGVSCIVTTFLLLGLGILGGASTGAADDSAEQGGTICLLFLAASLSCSWAVVVITKGIF